MGKITLPLEMVPDLDLGDDHWLVWLGWAPDDLPENRKNYGVPADQAMPRVDKFGAIIRHYDTEGQMCEAVITFDGYWARKVNAHNEHLWTVLFWEPLTIMPSLICGVCGDHGFINASRWRKA